MVNKKKRMGVIAGAAAAALVVASPNAALAASSIHLDGTGKAVEDTLVNGTMTYKGQVYEDLANNVIGNVAEINVNARTISGTDIVYDVTIDYGAMEFDYNYGGTWDPQTHSYGTGSQTAGWDVTKVDGTNNAIKITNDSNFPLDAEFSYDITGQTAMNRDPTAAGSVVGIFDTDNTNLLGLLSDGKGNTTAAKESLTTWIEMDHSALTPGQYYYYKFYKNEDNHRDIYFALSGTPDQYLNAYSTVGTIKITISPATYTTYERVVQSP